MNDVISCVPYNKRIKKFKDVYLEAISSKGMHHPWQAASGIGISAVQEDLVDRCKELSNIDNWILTDCGSDSLLIAILTLTNPGDLILVPAYGWISAANAVTILNRRIEFIDVDKTGNISIEAIKTYLNSGEEIPSAIIVIHSFGTIVDCKEIQDICSCFSIKIIEDAAQSFILDEQSLYKYLPGQYSDITCYSFDFTKIPGTLGTGGGIATNNSKYMDKIFRLSNLGKNKKIFVGNGIKSYMDTMTCSILLCELDLLKKFNNKSIIRQIAKWFDKNLKYNRITGENYIFQKYIIEVEDKDKILFDLRENNILASSTAEMDIANKMLFYSTKEFKGARWFGENTIQIPCHPYLTKENINRIRDTLNK